MQSHSDLTAATLPVLGQYLHFLKPWQLAVGQVRGTGAVLFLPLQTFGLVIEVPIGVDQRDSSYRSLGCYSY